VVKGFDFNLSEVSAYRLHKKESFNRYQAASGEDNGEAVHQIKSLALPRPE
jgi:hypothetical protein